MARTPRQPGLYLLHFHGFIGNPGNKTGQARHYLGYSPHMVDRVRKHAMGTSDVKLMRAVFYAGLTFEVSRIWPGGDRKQEYKLKRQGSRARLCPLCTALPLLPAASVPGPEFTAVTDEAFALRAA